MIYLGLLKNKIYLLSYHIEWNFFQIFILKNIILLRINKTS